MSPPKAEQCLRDDAGGGDAPKLQVPAAAPRTQAPVPGTSAPAASAALWPLRGLELRRGGVRGELASEGDHRCLALAARVSCPVSPVPTSNLCDSQCPPGVTRHFSGQSPRTWPVLLTQAAGAPEPYRYLPYLSLPSQYTPVPPIAHYCLPVSQHLPVSATASPCLLVPPVLPVPPGSPVSTP